MKAVVVSALEKGAAAEVMAALEPELRAAGFDAVERFDVAEEIRGTCRNELECWVREPAHRALHDAEQAVIAAIGAADAVVFVGPLAFGAHCHQLKRVLDRLIGLVSPFFEQRAELTHHRPRQYGHPRVHGVGLVDVADDALRATFDELNDANAVSLCAPERSSVVLETQKSGDWGAALRRMLAERQLPGAGIGSRAALRAELLARARPDVLPALGPVRTAALLVGSAKPNGASASEKLARAFESALTAEGVACRTHFASEFVHEGDRSLAPAREIAASDLLLLVSPLYVDAFPSLVTHALELVARVRSPQRDALFVPVVQCGFPEPEHARTAMRIARRFATAAGYHFAGGLPLGGGGVITADRSVAPEPAPFQHAARAVALSAPALAAGESVPEAALQAAVAAAVPDAARAAAGRSLRAPAPAASQSELARSRSVRAQ